MDKKEFLALTLVTSEESEVKNLKLRVPIAEAEEDDDDSKKEDKAKDEEHSQVNPVALDPETELKFKVLVKRYFHLF